MLTLRAHHLLCLPRFRGVGYSDRFSANMTRIAAALESEPQQVVCLTDGCDDICRHCPHRAEQGCALDEGSSLVVERDRYVLRLLKAENGDCLPYAELSARLAAAAEDAMPRRICGGCRWLTLCDGFA